MTCKSCAYFEVAFADCCAEDVVNEDICEGVKSVGTPDVNEGWIDGTVDVTICWLICGVVEDVVEDDIAVGVVNTSGQSLDVGFSSITKSIIEFMFKSLFF